MDRFVGRHEYKNRDGSGTETEQTVDAHPQTDLGQVGFLGGATTQSHPTGRRPRSEIFGARRLSFHRELFLVCFLFSCVAFVLVALCSSSLRRINVSISKLYELKSH